MPLFHLTRTDINAICALATQLIPATPAVSRGQTAILPSAEDVQRLDQLLTRQMTPYRLVLLRRIQALSPAAVTELAALMWFGRGDAPWPAIIDYAKRAYSASLPYYLADKHRLAEYVESGLQQLERQAQ